MSILGKNRTEGAERSGRSREEAIDLTLCEEVNVVKRQVVEVVENDVEEEEEHGEECDGTCLLIECVNGEPVRTCLRPEVCVKCLHYDEVDDQRYCGTCQQGNTSHARDKQQIGFSHMLENPDRDVLLEYLRDVMIVQCLHCSSLDDLRPTLPGHLEYICDSCESSDTADPTDNVYRCDQAIDHLEISCCGRYDKTVKENDGRYACKPCRSAARAAFFSQNR